MKIISLAVIMLVLLLGTAQAQSYILNSDLRAYFQDGGWNLPTSRKPRPGEANYVNMNPRGGNTNGIYTDCPKCNEPIDLSPTIYITLPVGTKIRAVNGSLFDRTRGKVVQIQVVDTGDTYWVPEIRPSQCTEQ